MLKFKSGNPPSVTNSPSSSPNVNHRPRRVADRFNLTNNCLQSGPAKNSGTTSFPSLPSAASFPVSISGITITTHGPGMERHSAFATSESGYNKANVVLQNISIPLAWPVEEYFGNKKEWREFTVQLVLRSEDGHKVYSKVVENVNRTQTDVLFDGSFVFPYSSPEFCIEVFVYCKRSDANAAPTFKQTISHSLGRSLGKSFKQYIREANHSISGASRFIDETNRPQTHSQNIPIDDEFLEGYRNPEKMLILGSARFRLRNASLSGRTHTYNLELVPMDAYQSVVNRSQLLPLYGNICVLVLVQPMSVGRPLAEGYLNVFFVAGGILLQNMYCVLQGGQLKCYSKRDTSNRQPLESTPLRRPANAQLKRSVSAANASTASEECTIESTAFPTALRLRLFERSTTKASRQFLLICESRSAFLGWKNAFNLQLADCAIWSDFAYTHKNPHGAVIDAKSSHNVDSAAENGRPNDSIVDKISDNIHLSETIKKGIISRAFGNGLRQNGGGTYNGQVVVNSLHLDHLPKPAARIRARIIDYDFQKRDTSRPAPSSTNTKPLSNHQQHGYNTIDFRSVTPDVYRNNGRPTPLNNNTYNNKTQYIKSYDESQVANRYVREPRVLPSVSKSKSFCTPANLIIYSTRL